MENKLNIKKELEELENDYLTKKNSLINNCNHIWKEEYVMGDQYYGRIYYKCKICKSKKSEPYGYPNGLLSTRRLLSEERENKTIK